MNQNETKSAGREQPTLVSSSAGTLHKKTREVVFTETGERYKMECGVLLAGVGHPYNRFMVEDFHERGDLCGRCFPEWNDNKTTDNCQEGP